MNIIRLNVMEKLVGRNKEIRELNQYIDDLSDGKGALVLISGEDGAGKTVFVEEVLKRSGLKVHPARANEDAQSPYSLFAAALRNCMRIDKTKVTSGTLAKYLPLLLPELGEFKGQIDPGTLQEAIISAAISAAESSQTILWFDDIHWADNASLDILTALADKISDYPLLIICAYRSDEITREHRIRRFRNELRRRRKLKEIILNPLSIEDSSQQIENLLSIQLSSTAVNTIYEQAQGIPLYIEELISTLKENDMLININGEYQLRAAENIPIPETVRDAVLQRMNTLSEKAVDLLQHASLYGIEFPIRFLSEITGSEKSLDELFDKGWIRETNNEYACFKNTVIMNAVRNEINWQRRRQMHRRIAKFLESTSSDPGLIAEHWIGANENLKAREALINSVESYSRIYAYKDAAERANKALEMWPSGLDIDSRITVLKKYAYCSQLSGGFHDAIRALKEVEEIAHQQDNISLLAETCSSLGAVYSVTGAGELSINLRISSAELYEKAGMLKEAASEYLFAAGKLSLMIHLDRAYSLVSHAVRLSDKIDDRHIKSRAMGLTGNILSRMAKFSQGKQLALDALKLALDSNDTEAAAEVYRRFASTMEYASDYAGARSAYESAYSYCINNGEEINARVCLTCMSYLFFQMGDWKQSLDICKDVIKSKDFPKTSVPIGYAMSGVIQALRGETKVAIKNLNEALNLSHKYNATACELLVLWGLAIVYDSAEDHTLAENYYSSIITRWQETQDMHDVIPCLMWAAVFFNERGLRKELTRTIEILSKIAASTENPEAMAAFSFALGEAAAGHSDYDISIEHYNQSLLHFQKLEIPLEQLFIEHRLALVLLKTGDQNSALKYLNRSYRTAKNLGTRPLASQIAMTISSTGHGAEESRDPESSERINRFGLTQRQYEILTLIGEGLTNKEIAGRLFLSNRTVDMHISHILQRLNCRTRIEAITKISNFEFRIAN